MKGCSETRWSIIVIIILAASQLLGCAHGEELSKESSWREVAKVTRLQCFHVEPLALESMGRDAQALQRLSALIEGGLALPSEYYRAVLQLIQENRMESALEIARLWVNTFPEDPAGLFFWAGFQVILGNTQAGLEAWQKIIDSGKNYAQEASALRDYVLALSVDQDPIRLRLELGRFYGSMGEWHLALRSFLWVIEADPGYAEGWAYYGEALQQCGLDGKDALDESLSLDPLSISANVFNAFYWSRQGDTSRALEFMQRVETLEPNQAIWKAETARIYAAQGNLDQALRYYQFAVQTEPGESKYWQLLAQFSANYEIDLRNIGLPAARQALSLAPDDPGALEIMGDILYRLNDLVGAERFLQQATVNPGYPLAKLRLAQIYIQLARLDEAHALLYDLLQETQPDLMENQIAQRLLRQYFGE